MKFTEEELEKHVLEKLQGDIQQLMTEMEMHQNMDSPADFERWWVAEGRIQKYFAMKGELEKRISSMQRQRKLRQQRVMAQREAEKEQREREESTQKMINDAVEEELERVRKIRYQG